MFLDYGDLLGPLYFFFFICLSWAESQFFLRLISPFYPKGGILDVSVWGSIIPVHNGARGRRELLGQTGVQRHLDTRETCSLYVVDVPLLGYLRSCGFKNHRNLSLQLRQERIIVALP
ncbi:hypothetical protein HOY80DRAFT_164762 [Tuber brumale]|nr:hypothetical protein HOY80DRAFT_164762 [Tuber brumale]